MPDLYAINLHLQERLEQDWREEVRAAEAAQWIDTAGLLRNYNSGLPLRRLLRAGRIAGQEQRPNRKNGAWFIRRLAASRDPDAIREARERLRRCLPIDRSALPPDWPVNHGPAAFWQELGKTVAAFGYLEHILASTCNALLSTGERATALLDANDHAAMSKWWKRLLRSQVDSMRGLTLELDRVLDEAGLVPRAVREDLVARLDELRPWRNALCHGAWLSVAEDGSGCLEHVYMYDGIPAGFERNVDVKRLSDVRARTVDIAIRIAEAASVAGPGYTHMGGTGYALATVMPRMYAPRNAPPEPDLLHAARRAVERDDTLNLELLTRRLAALDIGGGGGAPPSRNSEVSQLPRPPAPPGAAIGPPPGDVPKQRIPQDSIRFNTVLATGFRRSRSPGWCLSGHRLLALGSAVSTVNSNSSHNAGRAYISFIGGNIA